MNVSTASKSGAVATGFRQHDRAHLTPAMKKAAIEAIDRLPIQIETVLKLLRTKDKYLKITLENKKRKVEF